MTDILMPALSPTMTEAKVTKWLKKVGDEVKPGDVLVEIETDKATMEVEAVDEGTLSQILVEEGTVAVAVNSPIATVTIDGEKVAVEEQDLSTEEWEQVKLQALEHLIETRLDTPESHLRYIQERITTKMSWHA